VERGDREEKGTATRGQEDDLAGGRLGGEEEERRRKVLFKAKEEAEEGLFRRRQPGGRGGRGGRKQEKKLLGEKWERESCIRSDIHNGGSWARPVIGVALSFVCDGTTVAHILRSPPPPPRAQLCDRSCSNKSTRVRKV